MQTPGVSCFVTSFPIPSVSSSSTVAITTVPTPATTTTSLPGTSTTGVSTTTTTLAPLQSLAYDEVARIDFPIQMVPWSAFDLIATKDGSYDKIVGNVQEVRARDGKIISVVTEGDTVMLGVELHGPSGPEPSSQRYSSPPGQSGCVEPEASSVASSPAQMTASGPASAAGATHTAQSGIAAEVTLFRSLHSW